MLCLAFVYYDFSNQIKNYKYSDKEEYDTVTEGLSFIEKMPIHFNIINKYFSNMNNLSQKEKEEILMAYAIKNNYKLYNCGASTNTKSYLCINKSDLENSLFEDRFNLKLKFKNNNIDIYIDDYGMYKATSNNDSSYYKLTLDTSNNNNYRLYSIFDKYKKTDDTDVFYLYQGYYKGNCKKGEKLSLYDFLSGKKVYTNTCNGNNTFTLDIKNKAKYLQLYKYELKKDKNNNFYLAGYNPVKE